MQNEDPGVLMYPKARDGDAPAVKGFGTEKKKSRAPAIAAGILGAAILGAGGGYMAKPSHDDELAIAKTQADDQAKNAAAEHQVADQLRKDLDALKSDKAKEDDQLASLSTKSADVDKRAAELDAEQKKLQGLLDKDSGTVDTEGDEIHLKLVDKVLFATGDDQLTDKGTAVLDKVAAALKDLPDKQVWVQGHTDDQPIYLKKLDAKAAKVDPKTKVDPKAKPRKEYVTNWELSAARALQVVHYLQDVGKVDPSRLAALAFGQYRPISHNKAANRRIEIVLYPKKEVLVKAAKPAPATAATAAAAPATK